MSAYQKSIIDGYDNGFFGPGDLVTRAQVAKLIVNAKNPTDRSEEVLDEEVVEEEVSVETESEVVEGGLRVSLSPFQSPPLTVPLGSAAPLFFLDFTATDRDVTVSEIVLTRGGVGNVSDWHHIYAFLGFTKITSEYMLNGNTNKVTIPLKISVPTGETVSIMVFGNTDISATPLNQHYFYLDSAVDVGSDALSTMGNFPLTAHTITNGSQRTNSLAMTPGSLLSEPKRDQHSEIASFKLSAGASSDVAVKSLILTQGGSFSSSKMTDCTLLRGNDVISAAPGFYEDQIMFGLLEPFVVPAGQTKLFYVNCYIDGGRSTDTIQLYLDETYDLLTEHVDYKFSAVPFNYFNQTLAPTYNLRAVTIYFQ